MRVHQRSVRRLAGATAAAMTVGLAATLAGVAVAPAASAATTVTLSGVLSAGGGPVDGTSYAYNVTLVDPLGGYVTDATPAANGSWSLTADPGRYYLYFESTDGTYASEYWNNQQIRVNSTLVDTRGAGPFNTFNATLDLGGTISGTVTGAGAAPLDSIGVDATLISDSPNISGYQFASTDPLGNYTVTGLQAGQYLLSFHDLSGASYVDETYDNLAPRSNSGTAVTVPAGGAVTGKNAQLALGGTITGTITAAGSPVDAEIEVTNGTDSYYFYSDFLDGSYTASGLPAGTYRIRVSAPPTGYASAYLGGTSWASATTLTMTAGGSATGKNIDLSVGGTLTVSAAASGGTMTDACFEVFETDGVHQVAGQCPVGLTANFPHLAPGSYKVRATDNSLGGYRVPRWNGNAVSASTAGTVTISSGTTNAGTISLPLAGTSFVNSFALAASANPTAPGASFTLTATIAGSPVPTGDVGFSAYDPSGSGSGYVDLGSAVLNGSGVATLATSLPYVGAWQIDAYYLGDTAYYDDSASVRHDVASGATGVGTVSVAVGTPTINPGATTTLTATVTRTGGPAGAVGGSVAFTSDYGILGAAPVVSGVAALTVRGGNPGIYTAGATYYGEAATTPATSTDFYVAVDPTITVGIPTTTTVTSTPNPSAPAATATFNATVAPASGGAPTGTLWYDISNSVGTTVASGTAPVTAGLASFTQSFAAAGTYYVDTTFTPTPGSDWIASYDYASHQVSSVAATTTTVSATPNPATSGTATTLTATIAESNAATPGGTVSFTYGGSPVAGCQNVNVTSNTVNCSATFTGANLQNLAATYSGNGTFSGSTSAPVQLRIKVPTTSALATSLTPSTVGQSVTFTATVTDTDAASGPSGGTVAFQADGVAIAGCTAVPLVLPAQTAACPTSALATGNRSITAVFTSADLNFFNSTAPAITQVVNAAPALFNPVPPARVYDSRNAGQSKLGTGTTRDIQVSGLGGVPASGAVAVDLAVSAIGPAGSGFFTVWPTGQAKPLATTVNFVAGQFQTNLTKVPLGAGGKVSVYNHNGLVDVSFDVVGYYTDAGVAPAAAGPAAAVVPAGQKLTPVNPFRLFDSRPQFGGTGQVAAGTTRTIAVRGASAPGGTPSIPAGATAVEIEIEAIGPAAGGYLTAWPTGIARPLVSSVLYNPGRTVVTSAVTPIGADGTITVYAHTALDVAVDVVGYYAPDGQAAFVGTTPTRVYDSRDAGKTPLGANATRDIQVTGAAAANGAIPVPAGAKGVVFSLTSVNNTSPGYLTAWPQDQARPTAASLLPPFANAVTDNLVVSGLSPGGKISLYNFAGTTNVVLDIVGYYT